MKRKLGVVFLILTVMLLVTAQQYGGWWWLALAISSLATLWGIGFTSTRK